MKLLNKLYINRTVKWCTALLLMPILAGCGMMEDDPQPNASVTDISVSFRLYAGSSLATRAVDEYGTPDESYIDMKNLKILIFDENKVLKEVLYDNGELAQHTSVSQISRDYYIVNTKLDPEKFNIDSKFAIVALANWKSGETDTKFKTDWKNHPIDKTEVGTLIIDDLKTMTLTLNPDIEVTQPQPDSWIPGAKSSWIPMFGSRFTSLAGYSSTLFDETKPMPVPDVVLVRAISKIEIRNADEKGPTIESIMLTNRNQTGSLMQDYDFEKFTGNVSAPTYWNNNPQKSGRMMPFHQDGNTYTAYLPEMDLNNRDVRRAILVNLNMNGEKHQKWIYLAPYATNGLPNLEGTYNSDWKSLKRNYIYRYTINSLAFEFVIEVAPWIYGGKVHINLE